MAARGRRKDETFSADETSAVFQHEETSANNDAPAVFLCGKCKAPVGDTLSWAGSEEDQDQILLKRITDNVVIGKKPFVSGTRKELGCLVVNLNCRGCSAVLGMTYMSTPKKLDYKRSLFCFDVERLESYVLGSADQQMAELDTEKRPVSMEYQDVVEQELTEIKALAVTMGQRLFEVEVALQNKM